MRQRQRLPMQAGGSSRASGHDAAVPSPSLDTVRKACDPNRMGLIANNAFSIEIDHPYDSGRTVPDKEVLEDIIHVMSFRRNADQATGRGLNAVGVALAVRMFAEALTHVAPVSPDASAIRSVAAALRNTTQITVSRQPRRISEDIVEQNFQCRSRVGASEIADWMSQMRPGQHTFFLINNRSFVAHMVGLSLSKIDKDVVRVSLVNPVNSRVGSFIDAPLENIEPGMASFFSGDIFKHICATFVSESINEIPTQPESSTIFTEWMKTLNPGKALSSDYFDGKPLLQRSQKGGSCTIESAFALMATTLPRNAYKLAKAACLSTVLETGKALDALNPAERERIKERLDSAVRGIGSEAMPEKFKQYHWR